MAASAVAFVFIDLFDFTVRNRNLEMVRRLSS